MFGLVSVIVPFWKQKQTPKTISRDTPSTKTNIQKPAVSSNFELLREHFPLFYV